MATIDMTHRKINFPPRFLPYLEKHRIFELFHECFELLVQVRPRDHVQFLKSILPCATMKKDKQRIVFLAPSSFDRQTFANLLADCLGIQNVSRMYLETLTKEREKSEEIKTQKVDENVKEEESCVCQEEAEDEEIYYPPFYGSPGESRFSIEAEETPEKSIECVAEDKADQPCICVCPCVKEDEVEKKQESKIQLEEGVKERKKMNVEEKEEEENDWEGEDNDLPCESLKRDFSRRRRKEQKRKQVPFATTISEISSSVDTDYSVLANCEMAAKGWILQDFPTSGDEAKKLIELGVIPTHALRIILSEEEELKDREYKWTTINWMKAYKFVPVVEIKIGNRTMNRLSTDMCKILSVMPHRHAPMLPRIVLIGSRGSGVTTQAQKLAKKYELVHVEFEIVMARVLQKDDELSALYKRQLATTPDPELQAIFLEKVLLTSACRNRGWVLTGYPKNIDQMRMLDIIATPPNRIIFLEVPPRECFVRLYYRKIDPCLGDEYKLPKIQPYGLNSFETDGIETNVADRLLSHPKNNRKQIVHDIETYFSDKKDMVAYCGKTASQVDGNKSIDSVFELIEQIIINPAPAQLPRDPLAINHGIEESYERLKKFRLASGMFFNNLFLNPPERTLRP